MDISTIARGILDSRATWCDLYWLQPKTNCSLAIRRKVTDRMWYVTKEYIPYEVILYGPYPSKEAIEMLMLMDAIDLSV